MLRGLRALFRAKKQKPRRASRTSRKEKPVKRSPQTLEQTLSSREETPSSEWLKNLEVFKHMVKDFSRRLEAIRESPEESYLVNTEISLRLLKVLENLEQLTERNTVTLERLAADHALGTHQNQDEENKKRRAREVLSALERHGSLTYEELRKELKPQVSYNRVTALVSEMIRDGIPLKREGKPGELVRVSLREGLTGSN